MLEMSWVVAILLGYFIGGLLPVEDIIDFYRFQRAKHIGKTPTALSQSSETSL